MAETRPRHLLATLFSRFDTAALSVSPPGLPSPALLAPTPAEQALWAPLQRWCLKGAVGGAGPATQLSVAVWIAEPGSPAGEVVEAFSRHLDGSHQLQGAGGALAGLFLRLRVKVGDVAWWRSRRASDPWDCGYVLNEPAAFHALGRFRPRRATLMVAIDWPEPAMNSVLEGLARSSPQWAHPVRWLVVQSRNPGDAPPGFLAGLPVARLQPLDTER